MSWHHNNDQPHYGGNLAGQNQNFQQNAMLGMLMNGNMAQGWLATGIQVFGPGFSPFVGRVLSEYPSLWYIAGVAAMVFMLWKHGPQILQKVWAWLMNEILPSVAVLKTETTLYNNVLNHTYQEVAISTRRSITAQSATNARNCHGEKIANRKSVLFHGNSTTRRFRHNQRDFVLTQEKDQIKIWRLG